MPASGLNWASDRLAWPLMPIPERRNEPGPASDLQADLPNPLRYIERRVLGRSERLLMLQCALCGPNGHS